MKLQVNDFGKIDGEDVVLITLSNQNDMSISVTNYGCIVTAINVKDKYHKIDNVVLHYDTLEKYHLGHPFFGAVVGRFANRIKNGEFIINGIKYKLDTNEIDTLQHIHGGIKGFDKYVWGYVIEEQEQSIMVHFHRISVNGESGYPGNLDVVHTIGLDEDNQVHFYFRATTDQPTILNLTNHSYYNLSGVGKGDILSHNLKIYSDFYLPVDNQSIPTGEILSVDKTGFDFRKIKVIGDNMQKFADKSIDNTFILRGELEYSRFKKGIELHDPKSGRWMTMITTQPGVQVYNASKLSNKIWIGPNNLRYESFMGICFEAQHFPDSPNHAHFPSTQLNPGEVYDERTIHKFGN
ncbi:aldose 1-epimerase [Pasteurella testudinis DSM 23072]|uniref:Aldose 1-epimerase n=1 Tax=Pasteurella testudinis DSM 23072 TaxID=1122938 RepID=A0A1W1UAQ9_9PAST|nr:aldose epimerase family protein [Pasteurella testudinis]SMB78130.1 aldose 1-epimerase [Pasteurella testudinis DSM 23072]SUB52679.1 galactose mutarotase, aldose 1-epimerase [Pasteurella testudinis]